MLLLCIKLGSLEPGKFADFLVIDPKRLGASLENPYANLVLVTDERDLDRVMSEGNFESSMAKCCNRIWRGFRRKPIGAR
jgi:cytosine/adenosine deaminase-related metal-dependent hydrolase